MKEIILKGKDLHLEKVVDVAEVGPLLNYPQRLSQELENRGNLLKRFSRQGKRFMSSNRIWNACRSVN